MCSLSKFYRVRIAAGRIQHEAQRQAMPKGQPRMPAIKFANLRKKMLKQMIQAKLPKKK
jgi:hypothetical protein